MPRVGFEPTILAFERAKTFHALTRAGTVIGRRKYGRFIDDLFRKDDRCFNIFFVFNGVHGLSYRNTTPDQPPFKEKDRFEP
jgi:hypothetical protein